MADPVIAPVIAPVVPPATPAPGAPWYEGSDAALVGHLQNRGWDKLDAKGAALEAIKAHQEAAKFIGAPPDQIARIPTDRADEAGWKALHAKLGAPADSAGYDFTGVKFTDGTELPAGFADTFRAVAFQQGLTKEAATAVAAGYVKQVEAAKAAELAETTAKRAEGLAELQRNWGANYDANMLVAKNAALRLGVTEDQMKTLEGTVGNKVVLEMFQKIGASIGEDKFVTPLGGQPGVMTRESAVSQKSELMKDSLWVERYLKGDAAAVRQMTALNTIIIGDDTAYSRSRA